MLRRVIGIQTSAPFFRAGGTLSRILVAAGLTLLAACGTYTAPKQKDPLDGLVPAGFQRTTAKVGLETVPKGPIALVVTSGSEEMIRYARERVSTNAPPVDLVGTNATETASVDPRHSIAGITEILKRCFGEVSVASDFRDSLRREPNAIVLVDIAFDYPFMDLAGNKSTFTLEFFDRQLATIDRISVEGKHVPVPPTAKTYFIAQQRAIQALNQVISEKRRGSC